MSLLLDQSSAVKASYGYTAYGSANTAISKTASGFTDTNPYRYEAKRLDPGSDSYDMGARRYSPGTGRWLQQDVYYGAFDNLGLAQGPLNSNRYLFTGANPITYIELDGHVLAAGYESGTAGRLTLDEARNVPKLGVVDLTAVAQYDVRHETPPPRCGWFCDIAKTAFNIVSPIEEIKGCVKHRSLWNCAVAVASVTPAKGPLKAERLVKGVRDAKRARRAAEDAALEAQINDVADSVISTGKPPAGMRQGGLPGKPGVYGNKNGALPTKPEGHYTETDVWPGTGPRGTQRLVIGRNGEVWYTPDHYATFTRVR